MSKAQTSSQVRVPYILRYADFRAFCAEMLLNKRLV